MLTDRTTDDGRKVTTIVHSEHSSGELKTRPEMWISVLTRVIYTFKVRQNYVRCVSIVFRFPSEKGLSLTPLSVLVLLPV